MNKKQAINNKIKRDKAKKKRKKKKKKNITKDKARTPLPTKKKKKNKTNKQKTKKNKKRKEKKTSQLFLEFCARYLRRDCKQCISQIIFSYAYFIVANMYASFWCTPFTIVLFMKCILHSGAYRLLLCSLWNVCFILVHTVYYCALYEMYASF